MKKILTVATVVIMTALSAYAQTRGGNLSVTPCTLKASQAPEVRGIKLGMTAEDLLALFPGSVSEAGISQAVSKAPNFPSFGVVGLDIVPSRYSTKDRFAGIGYFNFVVLDGRLAQYEVQYQGAPNGPTWRNLDDFVGKIADAFQLPAPNNWTMNAYGASSKDLQCDGFKVRASNVNLSGYLRVSTAEAPLQVQQQRLAVFEEKARREFKP